MSTAVRHFLDLDLVDAAALRAILDDSRDRKRARAGRPAARPDADRPCADMLLAMIFEKPSTRTRVAFDAAMRQLGGQTLVLNSADMHLGRGETIADTARVLSRYTDAVMLRTAQHAKLRELAASADVPVINGLTDRSHPCQIMADVLTLEEHKGEAADCAVAWVGPGNNVTASWIHGAAAFGFSLRLCCPPTLAPDPALLECARARGGDISCISDPAAAVRGADCVVTDTWLSMSDGPEDAEHRRALLTPFQVNEGLMAAAPEAVFMHCLPARRGEEVTDAVIDGPRSVVFDEAENRVHVQKGVLAWCLGARG